MKWVCVGLALLLGAGALVAAVPQQEWLKVAPKDAKCEILFPAEPKVLPNQGGAQHILEREGGKSALMLQYNTLPNVIPIDNPNTVALVFNGGRDALVKAFPGSKIVSEKDVVVEKKYPGRDIDLEIPALGIYRVRIILTGPTLYQVTALGPKDYLAGPEATRFMKSFKFTK